MMNKCIILSVKPEHLHKILTGKKTIEIRKSMPKCDYPIDVYLYCTKGRGSDKSPILCSMSDLDYDEKTQEFIKKDTEYGLNVWKQLVPCFSILDGKIVAKFTLNKFWNYKVDCNKTLEEIGYNSYGIEICGIDDITKPLIKGSCLTLKEMYEYAPYKNLYAWHIDNLQIFDKPIELREFYRNNYQLIQDYESCNNYDCIYAVDNSILGDDGYCPVGECPRLRISRPPQSWCYAYKEE